MDWQAASPLAVFFELFLGSRHLLPMVDPDSSHLCGTPGTSMLSALSSEHITWYDYGLSVGLSLFPFSPHTPSKTGHRSSVAGQSLGHRSERN